MHFERASSAFNYFLRRGGGGGSVSGGGLPQGVYKKNGIKTTERTPEQTLKWKGSQEGDQAGGQRCRQADDKAIRQSDMYATHNIQNYP